MSIIADKAALFKKLADSIGMSFKIPDSELKVAEESLAYFEHAAGTLDAASEHLDVLYDPFKSNPTVSKESVVKGRGVLNRFKQTSKNKFTKFKKLSLLAIQKLNYFSQGDLDIEELVTTYESVVIELEEKVEDFLDVLDEYEADNFRDQVISTIELLKKKIDEVIDLIHDRIIDHIDEHLLGKTWLGEAKDQLQVEDFENVPYVVELYEERQKQLQNNIPSVSKDPQAMNPSDAPKAHYPDQLRTYPDWTRTKNLGEK